MVDNLRISLIRIPEIVSIVASVSLQKKLSMSIILIGKSSW